LINLRRKREAILQEFANPRAEKQKFSRWLLGTELTSQAVRVINTQIEELTEKETRLQEQQWMLEDRINDLQKQTYDAELLTS
jgi:hypothetical protein